MTIQEDGKIELNKILELNRKIFEMINYLNEHLKIEQKHSIVILEDFQKHLYINQEIDYTKLEKLEKAYNNLPEEQNYIGIEFMNFKEIF